MRLAWSSPPRAVLPARDRQRPSTWGEGCHNNLHAHPVSARHGLAWYEIDLNWYAIWTLKKLGLARHVYKIELDHLPPKPALVRDLDAAGVVVAAAGND